MMRQFSLTFAVCALLLGCSPTQDSVTFKLDYDNLIHLDAEELAEDGIKEAYAKLLPTFRHYLPEPADIEEIIDNDAPKYVVKCRGKEYVIYSPELKDGEAESWGRATCAFFSIVNAQLTNSEHRFYAI